MFYYCNLIGILAGIVGVSFRFGAVQYVRLKMLLTIVVPPAIPVTLLSGASFAITGFRRQGTHCIAPSRVNIVQRLLLSADLKTVIMGIQGPGRNKKMLGELLEDVYD